MYVFLVEECEMKFRWHVWRYDKQNREIINEGFDKTKLTFQWQPLLNSDSWHTQRWLDDMDMDRMMMTGSDILRSQAWEIIMMMIIMFTVAYLQWCIKVVCTVMNMYAVMHIQWSINSDVCIWVDKWYAQSLKGMVTDYFMMMIRCMHISQWWWCILVDKSTVW